jgi:hypothetical protein
MVQDILSYFKNPDAQKGDNVFNSQKIKLFWTSLWMILVINIGLSFFIYGVEALGWIDTDNHAVMDMIKDKSIIYNMAMVAIVAPLFEELIFRAPITLFRKLDPINFKVMFYLFALAFGVIHIFNFGITTNTMLLLPLLIAPQIVAGMFLGLIRVKVGLVYSMLFHALYNGILMIPYLIYFKYFEV